MARLSGTTLKTVQEANLTCRGAWDWAGNLTNGLQNQWTSIINDGNPEDILSTFADGAWVDFRTNPVLNSDITPADLMTFYMNILTAGTINYLWTEASIYLYCFQMSQSDCMRPVT
jgi:hypothetical protein